MSIRLILATGILLIVAQMEIAQHTLVAEEVTKGGPIAVSQRGGQLPYQYPPVFAISNASTRAIQESYTQNPTFVESQPFSSLFQPIWTENTHQAIAWFNAELLIWWMDDAPLPPLVTFAPVGTPALLAGVLGQSTTQILIGNNSVDYSDLPGARFSGGFWLDDCRTVGLEISGFFLEEGSETFFLGSDAGGTPILSRPTFNLLANSETSQLIAYPNAFAGTMDITSSSRLWGMEANSVWNMVSNSRLNAQFLLGFRYLDLDEDLDIHQNSRILQLGILGFNGTPILTPNAVSTADSFAARNRFYGAQLGIKGSVPFRKLSLGYSGKLGLGGNQRTVNVAGSTTLYPQTGTPQMTTGGLLALPSNIGHHTDNEFSALFELGLKLKYQVTTCLSVGLGYDWLWWNNVLRPGDQISRTIDPRQVPTSLQYNGAVNATQPTFNFRDSDYWAQGVNFELGFRF